MGQVPRRRECTGICNGLNDLGAQAIGIRHDQGREIVLGVADDQGLGDQRILGEQPFEVAGGDVLATGGDDQFLLAAGDLQKAVRLSMQPKSPVCNHPSRMITLGRGLPAVFQ